MGHYLSEIETSEEAEKRSADARDVGARIDAGFEKVWDSDDIWRCDLCEALILGVAWRNHLDKAHMDR